MKSDIGPYTILPRWVFEAPISAEALRLYLTLGYYANDQGEAWPSQRRLAEDMKVDIRSVRRYQNELIEAGALWVESQERENGSRTSNLYHLQYAAPGDTDTAVLGILTAVSGSELDPTELDDSTEVESQPFMPGRIRRFGTKTNDDGLAVALAVWEQRTADGTLPVAASKGRLIQLTRQVVAKVGSDVAMGVMAEIPDFTPGCVNFALKDINGHKTVVKPPDPNRPLSMAEKAAIRHAAQRKAANAAE